MTDWRRVSKDPPREGVQVLGYGRETDKVAIYVYRKGTFHCQDQEHFHGWGITWWAPVPIPPLGQARRERKARRKAERRRIADGGSS